MIAVRTNNLIADMNNRNRAILSVVFSANVGPTSWPSAVPVETRRQAIVPRSAPGPVLEVMLKNWPIDTIVKEVLAVRMALAKAMIDHDDVALKACEFELSKLAGLVEQHELREPGFAKRMWERVDERTEKDKIDFVEHTLLNVNHGGDMPGTLGAELSEDLKLALYQMTQKPADVPVGEAIPMAPPLDDADEVVRKAMEELANNQQSTI